MSNDTSSWDHVTLASGGDKKSRARGDLITESHKFTPPTQLNLVDAASVQANGRLGTEDTVKKVLSNQGEAQWAQRKFEQDKMEQNVEWSNVPIGSSSGHLFVECEKYPQLPLSLHTSVRRACSGGHVVGGQPILPLDPC